MSDWIDETLAALTLEEKIALLAGQDVWSTVPIERVGIPSIRLSDGPNGVRGFDDQHGVTSMSYPVGAAMGATFDPELVRQVGAALGEEARAHGASMLLGPTMNIPRVPNAGRNFECFSEDPVLSGTLAAAYVQGVQSQSVAACVKHVVCNDQETDRFSIDARVDERALREIYLEPFRIAIEAALPWGAMSAYNTINGVTASEQPLLDEVLRGEWGFDGLVVSDWFGTYSERAVTAGLDLEMPGPARWMAPEHVEAALASGAVTEDDLDRKVRNLLTLIERTGGGDREPPATGGLPETDEHRALARRVATGSIVLLHDDGLLPLATPRRIAVIGELAERTPHQGGGSSSVKPHRTVSILEGLRAAYGDDVEIVWSRGCDTWMRPPLLDQQGLSHEDGAGLRAEYFASRDLSGAPIRTEVLRKTFAGWFGESALGVDHERFGLRVTGTFTPTATGPHRFTYEAMGYARARFDGELVVDAWDAEPSTETWDADLAAGRPVTLEVEFGATPGRWRHLRIGAEPLTDGDPVLAAVDVARDADVAIVVVGLSDEWESEGFDRPDLRLPREQDRLVAAVAEAQPDTAVVIVAGSPVEVPWLEDVRSLVHVWYGGQEVGHAVADVLTGAADPGGRLPLTWPADSRQHPGLLNFPGEAGSVRYGEGVFVGYRAYDHLGLTPRFAFGHGLSYATFRLAAARASVTADAGLEVTATLVNTSDRAGSDVVQVYGRGIGGVPRRLVGFARAEVEAGQERELVIEVGRDRLSWWDPSADGWCAVSGALSLELRGTFGHEVLEVDLPSEAG